MKEILISYLELETTAETPTDIPEDSGKCHILLNEIEGFNCS